MTNLQQQTSIRMKLEEEDVDWKSRMKRYHQKWVIIFLFKLLVLFSKLAYSTIPSCNISYTPNVYEEPTY